MIAIEEPRISFNEGAFICLCEGCGAENLYTTKAAALKSLKRGNCRVCKKDYRIPREKDQDSFLEIYKNGVGLWCSKCDGCGKEQAYTRKDHARSSSRGGWKCKGCATYETKVAPSFYKDFKLADVDSFEKNALGRGFCWRLSADTVPDLWKDQEGKCALSGLPMVKYPRTWSIDRIDSNKGYELDNVQLVDKRMNMMKGTLEQDEFISLCAAVAETHKTKL